MKGANGYKCPNCWRNYPIDEIRQNLFCQNCGTFLNLQKHLRKEILNPGTDIESQLQIRKDIEKAKSIAQVLHEQFETKTGFFENYQMPEWILPEGMVEGSRAHALYLTYVISIDFLTDAVKLWKNARSMYQHCSDYFDPLNIITMDIDELVRITKELGARYPKNGANAWKKISTILLEKYDGDPRNITAIPKSIDEVKHHTAAFPYLRGPKLSNFYLRAMGEKNLFKLTNLNELDIPVDIQVTRFTIYTGCLELVRGVLKGCVQEPPIRLIIEDIWRVTARSFGIAPWELDEPIWTVGSKLCAKKSCRNCPVQEFCNQNFDAILKNNKLAWTR